MIMALVTRWEVRGSVISISGSSICWLFPNCCFSADLYVPYYLKIHHHPLLQPTYGVLLEAVNISHTREERETLQGFCWYPYFHSIFSSLHWMTMTLNIHLISVHSVALSWAPSAHTSEPSPQLHPMLRVTICSIFLESLNFRYSVLLPNQMPDHMLCIFFGGNIFIYLCFSSLNSAHQNFCCFC